MKIPKIILISWLSLLVLPSITASADLTNYNQPNSQDHIYTKAPNLQQDRSTPRIRLVKPKLNPRSNHQTVQQDLKQMKQQTLKEVNSDRSLHDVSPIKTNKKLEQLAQLRAEQISHRFNHYDKSGYPYTTDDASIAHLPHGFRGSENIASSGLGKCITIGDPKTYDNHNGYQMAKMTNDAMMNHDQLEANGHRKNILDSRSTLIGVGTFYSYSKHEFYLAEDFGNRDASSSEDVDHITGNPARKLTTGSILKQFQADVHQKIVSGVRFFKNFF